ncbi:hypothetical protein [Bifidobacterium avesanii]|uniref:Uncharacterized protein n=1 Tax=Bifidobacterium avesanii TaxID=1798157 RepID=A0A7K3TF30_9BIFI|nr:hypothetical protein [Bifidobacterium avesanii]KAB8287049.1 hypothetical protein DSM100685_1980 [Bifidobacterium avesanii]NEG77701.1 hypothetical protein [Bifidobacterium avesanii]
MASFTGIARTGTAVVAALALAGLTLTVPSDGIADGDASQSRIAAQTAGQTASYAKTQRVFSVFGDDGEPGPLIVDNAFAVQSPGTIVDVDASGHATTLSADHAGDLASQTVLAAGAKALPWTVRVTYSLNGPDTTASAVTGADGLVGIRIRLEANPLSDTRYFRDATPIVTFTVPHDVTDAVAAPDGATVTDDGDDFRVTAVGKAGQTNEWYCYLSAKSFRMGRLIVAAAPAADRNALRDRLTALAQDASSLAGGMTNAGSGEHQALIDQLTAIRDQEKAAADAEIAAKHDAYVKQFGVYIDRYVRSYSSHLSGSPGTKTQMGALIGMTGELTGSTSLAQSVTDLANAVNAMSAAHEHTGAANVLDEVIRQIQRRGTTGLLADLKARQTKEAGTGKTRYATGQGQLANAMIPFSMAYTDTYTAKLNDLVNAGGSVSGSEQTAIDQTNQAFGSDENMQRITGQISAALKTMSGASEHTGAANMLGRIIDEFGAQLSGSDASDDSSSPSQTGPSGAFDASAVALWNGRPDPFTPIGTGAGASALRPQNAAALLASGDDGLIDDSTVIGDCAQDLTAALAALPADDSVSGSASASEPASGVTVGSGTSGGDVVSAANAHTSSASFLLVLPAVGDADSLAASGSGDDTAVTSSIPGLGAIVNKFMG